MTRKAEMKTLWNIHGTFYSVKFMWHLLHGDVCNIRLFWEVTTQVCLQTGLKINWNNSTKMQFNVSTTSDASLGEEKWAKCAYLLWRVQTSLVDRQTFICCKCHTLTEYYIFWNSLMLNRFNNIIFFSFWKWISCFQEIFKNFPTWLSFPEKRVFIMLRMSHFLSKILSNGDIWHIKIKR